jgi:hypothetical protein
MKKLQIQKRGPREKTPAANISGPIELDFTPEQSNPLSLYATSTASKEMLHSQHGNSAPQMGMAEYYQSRASSDERLVEYELKLNKEK